MSLGKKNKFPVIGLTGLPCSGKTLAAEILQELGAFIIDVDKVGHQALKTPEVITQICKMFGDDIITDSAIDRKKMGSIVFSSDSQLKKLERIVHPWMCAQVSRQVQQQIAHKPVVIDAAILQHMGLDKLCDTVLLIESDQLLRQKRAEQRGWAIPKLNLRDQTIQNRLNREQCLIVKNNENNIETFKEALTHIFKDITNE